MTDAGRLAIRPVRYRTGRVQGEEYIPPRNTCDPRWDRCVDHHVACDCREAEQAEHVDELRSELEYLRTTIEGMWHGAPSDVRRAVMAESYARYVGEDEAIYRRALYRIAGGRSSPDEMRTVARHALNGTVDLLSDVPF